jgi:hypothetical protein
LEFARVLGEILAELWDAEQTGRGNRPPGDHPPRRPGGGPEPGPDECSSL